MPKLGKNDWDYFCALLESQKFRGSTTRLTGDSFLEVTIQNQGEEIPSVKGQSSILKDTGEITILLGNNKHLDYEGVEKVIYELNCLDEIKYILLCYVGEKNYADVLRQMLRRSGRLIRKIPMVISLPQKVYNQVTNPA